MAQASIAQREPSMEEILASIRRIIEDSDTAAKPAGGGDEAAEAAFARPEAANTQGPEATGEVEVFLHELRAEPASGEDEPGFDRLQEPAEVAESADDVGGEVFESGAHPPSEMPQDGAAAERHGNSLWDVMPGQAAAVTREAAPAPLETAAAPPPSIISEAAGRQVAAAFDELSVATFTASRSRSFDDMAEDMLRPMLQDWLDNNLPTMVERLVREEIERIARGGTR